MSIKPLSQPINLQTDWKVELSQCVSSIDELLDQLGLNAEDLTASEQVARFPNKSTDPLCN